MYMLIYIKYINLSIFGASISFKLTFSTSGYKYISHKSILATSFESIHTYFFGEDRGLFVCFYHTQLDPGSALLPAARVWGIGCLQEFTRLHYLRSIAAAQGSVCICASVDQTTDVDL